jgi:antitoxin YqcF
MTTNDNTLPSLLFDHYEKFLGSPTGRWIFRANDNDSTLQVLRFDDVFEGCAVYASFGASKFIVELGECVELVLVTDFDVEEMPKLLANLLFFAASSLKSLAIGSVIGGLSVIAGEVFDGRAIYIGGAHGLPIEFERFAIEPDLDVKIKMAVFINNTERAYVDKFGVEAFEKLMAAQNIDPFCFERESARFND